MAFEVQCKILELLPEQRGTSSRGEWVRRGFVAETLGEYPKKMQFDVMGDERWQKMSQYVQVGREVKVSFDVESRNWNNKWFTSLSCFSVYGGGGQQQQQAPAQQQSAVPNSQQAPAGSSENTDDLPF